MKRVKESSGNVFWDLGLPDPDGLLAKAELTRQLYEAIKQRGLTQAEAAKLLGLRQPDVSKLMRAQHTGFSTDRLMKLLTRLGHDVQIIVRVRPKGHATGRMTVTQ
jgi:predicted XRE-type DNA-binding protein